jgi:hypothetical protein
MGAGRTAPKATDGHICALDLLDHGPEFLWLRQSPPLDAPAWRGKPMDSGAGER